MPGNVDSFMTRQTFQPIRAIPATVSVHSSTLNQPLRTGVGWFVDKAPDPADHRLRVTNRNQMIAHRPPASEHRAQAFTAPRYDANRAAVRRELVCAACSPPTTF
ncbi:hypothetical protein GCM10009743_70240 [Kribbella swartbergensis]